MTETTTTTDRLTAEEAAAAAAPFIRKLTAERDRARDIAVRLEQELAHVGEAFTALMRDYFHITEDDMIELAHYLSTAGETDRPGAKRMASWVIASADNVLAADRATRR